MIREYYSFAKDADLEALCLHPLFSITDKPGITGCLLGSANLAALCAGVLSCQSTRHGCVTIEGT